MTERVFQRVNAVNGDVFEVRFPAGVTRATSVGIAGTCLGATGVWWSLDEMGGDCKETTKPPADLPPTTADLNTELAAYKQFADAITASFGDDAKRNHQMDYQHAYDRLRASIQLKGSDA